MTSSDLWSAETAARYDAEGAAMFAPEVLDPCVEALADLAGDGPALELAIGTGRVALPLIERGVEVHGIELSPHMVERLHAKRADVPIVVGGMATATAPGTYALVYLVWNTIGNLTTQAEQVACFRNAGRHLRPGGRFVVEVGVPSLRRMPPGQRGIPFDVSDAHVGLDTYDPVTQRAVSHHFTALPDGTYRRGTHHFRYVWPSELALMAALAGLELERRRADWRGAPFTAESESHVSVWRLPT